MSQTISIYEAKAHLSRVIADVIQTRRPITISRHNKPVVDVVVHVEQRDPLARDPLLKGARFNGDPCAPVSETDWPMELR